MRAAFARYGECLFLDFIKRKLNRLNWRYIGPCVIDGYKKVRVVAECILVSERAASYVFVLRSLFEMSENCRTKECVYAVFADGFFSDDILTASGIGDTCRFFGTNITYCRKTGPTSLVEHDHNYQDLTFQSRPVDLSQHETNADLGGKKRSLGCMQAPQSKHSSRRRIKSSREVASSISGKE